MKACSRGRRRQRLDRNPALGLAVRAHRHGRAAFCGQRTEHDGGLVQRRERRRGAETKIASLFERADYAALKRIETADGRPSSWSRPSTRSRSRPQRAQGIRSEPILGRRSEAAGGPDGVGIQEKRRSQQRTRHRARGRRSSARMRGARGSSHAPTPTRKHNARPRPKRLPRRNASVRRRPPPNNSARQKWPSREPLISRPKKPMRSTSRSARGASESTERRAADAHRPEEPSEGDVAGACDVQIPAADVGERDRRGAVTATGTRTEVEGVRAEGEERLPSGRLGRRHWRKGDEHKHEDDRKDRSSRRRWMPLMLWCFVRRRATGL